MKIDQVRAFALLLAPEFIEKLLCGEKAVGLRISLVTAKLALVSKGTIEPV